MGRKRTIPPLRELKKMVMLSRAQSGKTLSILHYENIFHRPISIYLTKLFLMVGVTPNTVTFVSYPFVVATGVLFIFGNYPYLLIGIAIYQLYIILDCCDGDMARYLYGSNNPRGEFLEYMGHRIIQPFITVCLAFGVYNNPQSLLIGPIFHQNITILVIGLVGSNLSLVLHVLDYYPKLRPNDATTSEASSSLLRKYGGLQYIFNVVGNFRVWLIKYNITDLILLITVVSNTAWIYLFFYAIIPFPLLLINAAVSYMQSSKPCCESYNGKGYSDKV